MNNGSKPSSSVKYTKPFPSVFIGMDALPLCSLLLSWHIITFHSLSLIVAAQSSNDPSTDWALSNYYDVESYPFSGLRFSDFIFCNNRSTSLELLNEEAGLYGRILSRDSMIVYSAHCLLDYYTMCFGLYFAITSDKVCMKDNGSSIPAYYLSMVAVNEFGRSHDPRKGQVVWTANPDKPVSNYACVHLNDTDLTLVDYHDIIGSSPEVVWHIRTNASSVSLTISFEGNLVLFSNITDPPYVPLWESFRYPSDTLMVLQVLDKDRTLTVDSMATSNSGNTATSKSAGNYTLAFENGRLVLYARIGQLVDHSDSPYGSPYWVWPRSSASVHAHDNTSFAAFCWDPVNQLRLYAGSNRLADNATEYQGMVSPEFCSTIPNNSDTTSPVTGLNQSMNVTYATFLRLEADGDLRAYTVDNTSYPSSTAIWRPFYNVFNSTPCDLPLYCGSYGMCDPQSRGGSCKCNYSDDPTLPMVFSDTSDPKAGCDLQNGVAAKLWDVHNISSSGQATTCTTSNMAPCTAKQSGCKVDFLSVDNVHYFSLNFTKRYQELNSSDFCKLACENNCSCAAAFWDGTNNRCFLVLGPLGTIRRQGSMQAFIKYVKIVATHSNPWKVAMVGSILAAAFIVASILLVFWLRRIAQKKSELKKERLLMLSLLDCDNTERLTWKQLHEYTCGFSDLLGGGGFGRVFRGALPDGTSIAVKQLDEDRSQGQGNKEFIAEVSILSRIHHAHLVHLIGFCLEGNHKLLVYEYLENGSLDAWIFKNYSPPVVVQEANRNVNDKDKRSKSLLWKARFQIAVGTAKGLAYLHEECEEKVIHMDLKPQNILLNRNFLAKISDFGTSTRTGHEQTSVMTVMRGNPGYLAPEWLVDCVITEKCDVYSFGIVLLEMVAGKKLKDLDAVKQKLRMRPLKESVMLDLLDENLRYDRYGSDVNEKEAVRMVKVALMCVRRNPTKRPAMSSVASMLEGKEDVLQDGADDDEYDDAEEERELVMYPSAMHRDMRTEQRSHERVQGIDMYANTSSSLRSFTDYSGSEMSSSNMWWNPDDNHNYNSCYDYSGNLEQKVHNNSYNKYYLKMDQQYTNNHNKYFRNMDQQQAKAASLFQRKYTTSPPPSAWESDHLLQRQQS